jgi:hypothetical protein
MIGLMIVLNGFPLWLKAQGSQPPPQDAKNAGAFMQWFAAEAVKEAEKDWHVKLDYSAESIKAVDQILGRMHAQYVKEPASVSVRGFGFAYGSYVGEVIRRTETDVHWERDHPVLGEKSYPLYWGGIVSVPVSWCQKRIANGDEDNLWFKYTTLKEEKRKLDLKHHSAER